jgi:RimJ/RimL family protein N-acetyltransferase
VPRSRGRHGGWRLNLRSDTWSSLTGCSREQFGEVELGWTLRADHWGHGYATEAAQACLDWGFARLDDDYFTALMRPGNDASVRVAVRLGFAPRREDHLQGRPVTVYAVDRPANLPAR